MLNTIHRAFGELYGAERGRPFAMEPFAMEVEFKVLENGELFIKQARPWVY